MNLNWIKQFEATPYSGEEKEGYTLTYIPHLQSLLLLGGNLAWSSANQLYLYNLISKSWSLQRVSTPKPTARKYHSAYYEKMIKGVIVYGGQAEKKRSLDCFWVLFVDEWKWRKLIFKSGMPSAREFHTFTPMSNGNYIIFGGITLPYQTYLQDVWILKGVEKLKDTKTLEMVGCTCTEISGKGQIPTGRYGHSSYYWNQNFYVIGGQSQKQEDNFTIYNLNMRTMFWQQHNFNINLSQLMGTSILSNPINPKQIFILGGITSANKPNSFVYTLTFQKNVEQEMKMDKKKKQQNQQKSTIDLRLRKCDKIPYNQLSFDCVCELPFNQVFGICCSCYNGKIDLYRVELRQQIEQLGIEDYLKYIKNQQLLSQELLTKVSNLETLYQQIQSFTSKLYKKYQKNDEYGPEIQREKTTNRNLSAVEKTIWGVGFDLCQKLRRVNKVKERACWHKLIFRRMHGN